MNILSKTLTKTSKSNIFLPLIPIHLHPFSSSSPYSTKFPNNESQVQALSPKKNKHLERPSEILFQPKVANWLSLIGTVKIPVESCTATDGKSWAGTIISQEGRSGSTYKNIPWISVIFEGDLAITAATHLKENDTVYVAGHLSPDYLPINLTNDQVKVQVMAHDFHFVRKVPDMKKDERVNYSIRFNGTQPGQWREDCARLESAELILIPKQLPYYRSVVIQIYRKACDYIVFELYNYGPNTDYFRLNVVKVVKIVNLIVIWEDESHRYVNNKQKR